MARNDRFKKHRKGGHKQKRSNKREVPNKRFAKKEDKREASNKRFTKKEDLKLEIPIKKQKVSEREDVSSDSEVEIDHFNNLLSSFNVTREENVVETDESDASDSEDNSPDHTSEEAIKMAIDNVNDVIDEEGSDEEGEESDGDHTIDSGCEDQGIDENVYDTIDVRPETVDDVSSNDPFVEHFKYDLSENLLEAVQSTPPSNQMVQDYWPILGSVKFYLPTIKKHDSLKNFKIIDDDETTYASEGSVPSRITSVDLLKLHVKSQIHSNLTIANSQNITDMKDLFTPLQKEIFSIVNNYQDLYFPCRDFENGEEVRFVYTLHSVNHILKTRTKIVHHNSKIQNKKDKDNIPDEFRDQGLVRPKVLILVPFKDSAFRVIKIIMSLLHPNDKGHVINKARFLEEFTGEGIVFPHKNPRPEDYEKTFCGNTDDNFKIGLSITRKSVKLYVDFYSADIIIASPLGLRLIIGAEGEPSREYDFLASIEVLVLDQSEIFLMQNWDHVLHIMNHLHLLPKESHGTDFSRVRSWAINGWTRFYRQTVIFSSIAVPEINSLFNKKCHNYAGKVRTEKLYDKGSVCQVILQLSQVFHRFSATGGQSVIDARFDFFTKKIIPQFTDTSTSHVLVYVPSYFDFVRIRNYFKREDMSFVQICEYTKDNKIARARDLFFHNEAHFLLYSERAHFFRRFRLKGIRHIIFYQPPTFPHFYSELCNFMASSGKSQDLASESTKSVMVMYAKSDGLQISGIVGTERAARILSSDREVHMFVSGE